MSELAVQAKKKKSSKSLEPAFRSSEKVSEKSTSQSAPSTTTLNASYSAGPTVSLTPTLQAKFSIGKAGDPFEREADTVADHVVSGKNAPPISPLPAGGLGSIAKLELPNEESDENISQAQLLQRVEEYQEEPTPQSKHIQRSSGDGFSEEADAETPVQTWPLQRTEADEEIEEPPQTLLVQRLEDGNNEEEEQISQPCLIQKTDDEEEEITQPTLLQREENTEDEAPQTALIQRMGDEQEDGSPQEVNEEESLLQTKPLQQCNCSGSDESPGTDQAIVQKESQLDDGNDLQLQGRNTSQKTKTQGSNALSSAINNAGTGESLQSDIKSSMESSTGLDFNDVRVHSDGAAQQATSAVRARAFTHGSDIWLGSGESQSDQRLMAHELTHVVQQTSGAGGVQTIQRKPADYRHPEDGGGVHNRLQNRFTEEIDESETEVEEGADAETNARSRTRQIDRGELRQKSDEIKLDTVPDINRPAMEKPSVDQSAQQVVKETETPGEVIVDEEQPEAPTEVEGAEKDSISVAEQATALADQAFSAADSQPEPESQIAVVPPEPIVPVDSEGSPLAGNPETDAQVSDIAERAQLLRDGGSRLRAQAAEGRSNAQVLRGNLAKVSGEIGKAEEGITKSKANSEYRQTLKGQAEEALTASEEKAATVAEQAPGFTSKADEGKEDTGPMSQEANDLAARNDENTPDDPEAAAKSREQGQKINSTGNDAATMDDAVSQTRERAGSLAEDAMRAAEMNTQSQEKITETQEKLTETDARLEQMTGETTEAKSRVEGLRQAPNQVTEQANQLDQRGLALITASFDLESRLRNMQLSYEQGMRSVPALRPWEGEQEDTEQTDTESVPIQKTPETGSENQESPADDPSFTESVFEGYLDPDEGRYDEREQVNIAGVLPGWVTGVDPASETQREEAQERENQRRQNEVDQINQEAGGRFEDLDAGDKMGIALRLTGQNFSNSISNIKWPGWGGLAKMLLDPRTMLMGVMSGLSMMLSGGANLFSREQWVSDPLGNLLKSAADIATGLTIVLASITALAGLVAAVMGALILFTLGAASPVALPVISVCTTIITTVGGWTIAVGKVALVLQALSLIKNLVDAATAETAGDLQNQSDQIRADTVAAGTVVLSIVGAKGAAAGVRNLSHRALQRSLVTRGAGGIRARARSLGILESQRVGGGLRRAGQFIGSGASAVGRAGTAVGRGIVRGGKAIGRGAKTVGRGLTATGRAMGRGVRGLRDRLRGRRGSRRASLTATERTLAETPASRGHRVRITSRGNVDVCTNCTNLSLVYREALSQNPSLQTQFARVRSKAARASQMEEAALLADDAKLLRRSERLAEEAARDAARLERRLAETGIVRDGVRFKPEPALFGNRKHGIDWTDGPRRLRETGNPQGQFGQVRDVQFAVDSGAGLGPGQVGHFRLPADHDSFVWIMRNGNPVKVRADAVFVKVRADGVVHAFPELSTNIPSGT